MVQKLVLDLENHPTLFCRETGDSMQLQVQYLSLAMELPVRSKRQVHRAAISGMMRRGGGGRPTGADLARHQGGGDTQGVVVVNWGWGVGWTVELKLNRKKGKKGFQRDGGCDPPNPL